MNQTILQHKVRRNC